MSLTTRLLGLAFASADTLVEVDANGVVAFAMGAGPVGGQDAASWIGRKMVDLLHDGETPGAAVLSSKVGARSAPIACLVQCGPDRVRRATIRTFVLPQLAPAVSCSLSYEGPAFSLAEIETAPLLDAQDFLASAGRALGSQALTADGVAFGFLDVRGLEQADDAVAERLNRRIEATLQSVALDRTTAARLTSDRFAVLRASGDTRDIAAEIMEAGRAEGIALEATSNNAPVPPGSEPLCVLRAMRFAVEACLKDGGLANPQLAFADSLKRTFRDAETFRSVVKSRDFAIHYQPIVSLDTRAVHHFEALARFNANSGPANAIRMAEELALIESFDLAVAEKVLTRMRQPGSGLLKMAINVSAASLATDVYVEGLMRLTSGAPEDRRRLTVEVTETAAIADIEAANRRLTALRDTGIKICIDDFGAGATSFDYLRKLPVDSVKIDGAYVRDIQTDQRARALVTGLVEMCRAMKLSIIAEMIETEAVATEVKAMGVEYGQGWLFGRAEAEPRTTLTSGAPVRRRGAVEAWG